MKDHYTDNPLEALTEIKSMMQKSSRIFSLSGWSGIWAGIVGLLAALYVRTIFNQNLTVNQYIDYSNITLTIDQIKEIVIIACLTFILAVLGAFYFSYSKNKKQGNPVHYNAIAQKLLINLAIPIGAGGIFCLVFGQQGDFQYIIPTSLCFYGIALISASKYTFTEIKYLGLLEVILGLIAILIMRWHLFIWAIGFGGLHIIYGILMWYKYDKK